jgi:type II secretory pathway pseudopilin PulG
LATSRWNASSEAGFSLAESLIATAILATSIAALGQLFAVSVVANRTARGTTFAAVLASQKMEQLRGLTYGFDGLGLPLTDTTTDLSTSPPTATEGRGLSPSPGDSLRINTAGYVDFLNEYGAPLGDGSASVPIGTVYIRRWSVEPLPTNPNNTIIIQVAVTRASATNTTQTRTGRAPQDARLVTVKTRKAT